MDAWIWTKISVGGGFWRFQRSGTLKPPVSFNPDSNRSCMREGRSTLENIGKGICDEVEMEFIEFRKATLNCLSVQDSKKWQTWPAQWTCCTRSWLVKYDVPQSSSYARATVRCIFGWVSLNSSQPHKFNVVLFRQWQLSSIFLNQQPITTLT